MISLPGHINLLARAEYDRGSVNAEKPIRGVSLFFKPSPEQYAALQRLLTEQQDPTSPNFRKWLTPDQYAERFGMSAEDLTRITSWLQSQGFKGIQVARNHSRVSFDGTAGQIASVFETEIHQYDVNGEIHFANATEPSVPEAIAASVLGIRHLDNFQPQPRSHRVPAARFTSGQSGNHFVSPGDFATIYNVQPLYDAGFDGAGTTIAVVGQTQINVSDTNRFRSLSGLSVNPPQIVLVPETGLSTVCSSDLDEANLDVQWSGAVAKNATILYVYAGLGTAAGNTCDDRHSTVFDAVQYVIENDLAPVIGLSYGLCEAHFGMSNAQIVRQWIQQANTQGQTLSAASGDSGAADCDTGTAATEGLAVDIPAAIPEVTGVGGTEFSADVSSPATYWNNAGSTDLVDSAISFIPEMAWNDSPTTGTGPVLSTKLFAGGGGVSSFFPKPTWQAPPVTPNDSHRDVPDISLHASPNHDGYLVCSRNDCVNGFRATDGGLTVFGGTSISSQLFAGILAIINQATQSGGLGNVNPTLYSLAASTPAAFHDTTSGSIKVPCNSGTPNCPASAPFQIGYNAGAGYDLATGLGSINADTLTRAWPNFTSSPDFSISSSPSAVTIASAGANSNTTISVVTANGFIGTVNLSCVLIPLDAQATCTIPASVTLDGSVTPATAALHISTTAAHASSTTTASWRRLGWITTTVGLLAGFFLFRIPSRRTTILGLLCCFFLLTGLGCGGGSSNSNNGGGGSGTPPIPGTPAGTYTVSVRAANTADTVVHSTNVRITVQ